MTIMIHNKIKYNQLFMGTNVDNCVTDVALVSLRILWIFWFFN